MHTLFDTSPRTQNTLISARQWATGCWFPEVWKFLLPFGLAVKQHTHFFLLPTQSVLPPLEHWFLIWFLSSFKLHFDLKWDIVLFIFKLFNLHTWHERCLIWCIPCCSLNVFNGKLLSSTYNRYVAFTSTYSTWLHHIRPYHSEHIHFMLLFFFFFFSPVVLFL